MLSSQSLQDDRAKDDAARETESRDEHATAGYAWDADASHVPQDASQHGWSPQSHALRSYSCMRAESAQQGVGTYLSQQAELYRRRRVRLPG